MWQWRSIILARFVDSISFPAAGSANPVQRPRRTGTGATMIGMIPNLIPLGLRGQDGLQFDGKEDDAKRELRVGFRLRARVRRAPLRLQRGGLRPARGAGRGQARLRRPGPEPGGARRPPRPRGQRRDRRARPRAWESTSTRTGRTWSVPPTAASFTGSAASSSAAPGSISGSRRGARRVFDERTQTFGYLQPDRSPELIELSKEPPGAASPIAASAPPRGGGSGGGGVGVGARALRSRSRPPPAWIRPRGLPVNVTEPRRAGSTSRPTRSRRRRAGTTGCLLARPWRGAACSGSDDLRPRGVAPPVRQLLGAGIDQ